MGYKDLGNDWAPEYKYCISCRDVGEQSVCSDCYSKAMRENELLMAIRETALDWRDGGSDNARENYELFEDAIDGYDEAMK